MNALLEKTFGPNYRTTLAAVSAGTFALLAFVIDLGTQIAPLAPFLPESVVGGIKYGSALAAAISLVLQGLFSKDRHVTGGTVRQDADTFPRLALDEPDDQLPGV